VSLTWKAAGDSDVGRQRRGNEDNLHLDPGRGIFVVADGMGGHAAGEVASELAARAAAEVLAAHVDSGRGAADAEAALRRVMQLAHERILNCCDDRPATKGMGTTLTCCLLDREGACRAVHIGDTRIYRVRGGVMEQLTRDHTWVQREVDEGRLRPAEARRHPLSHILTRVLSDDHAPEPDLLATDLLAGDLLLLCSDGLYNMVTDARIAEILVHPSPLAARVRDLIDAANAAGGADNVTVVVVEAEEV
jgi:PPM family protein phosphatase